MTQALPILILYGSQSGNSEEIAVQAGKAAISHGLTATVKAMDETSTSEISASNRVLICCSTWGDGEQPDNAIELFEAVESSNIDYLENVNFAVLALGDTAFDLFCEAGIQWDEILEKKGAKRINDRIDCDVDYEDDAEEWIEETIVKFSNMD